MIPLRLKAQVEGGDCAPFVAILQARSDTNNGLTPAKLYERHRADLVSEGNGKLSFLVHSRTLQLHHPQFDDIRGDVLLVVPERGIAHRLIRSRSNHNSLLVTEQCDQLCVMCSQPPKKEHQDLFEHFLIAAQLAPRNVLLGISGGEPTLHKRALFDFIKRVHESRPDIRFHILTNAQHFTSADIAIFEQPAFKDVCWGVPIYSADAQEHDAVVGKQGAFDTLLHSLTILMRSSSYVELRTVLMRANEPGLGKLASFVGTHLSFSAVWAIMQLENIGFARKVWDEIFFDNSADFSQLALAINAATARGIKVELYNFPLCTIPIPYRKFAIRSISDWKQRYLAACTKCSEQQRCAGFFEWYPEERGFSRIHPL